MADNDVVASELVSFVAGTEGLWRIDGILAPKGETLPPAARLAVVEGDAADGAQQRWVLRGMVGPQVYVEDAEQDALVAEQPPLGRPEARCAALVAVRKSPAWWALPHDERRAVLEERSHHIATGLEYLPAVARRLHHAHELTEPFDFLSWFEYSPADQEAFDELVARLRTTEEWSFVEREVDVRLTR
ncbi:MAG TPA: chlorite dismutase family protein [Acidimicrobiales bacterium]|jgi:hypothetical protein|nr:chlorite dismutase family protein [Acidimicrobiales bacterium]